MKHLWRELSCIALSTSLVCSAQSQASERRGAYEVTVTNVTQGEVFTPIMVASHPRGVELFQLGEAAGNELAMLAEGGDPGPLSAALLRQGAHDVAVAGDVLPPGGSVTLYVDTRGNSQYLSLASMLVPSNDAFMALNGVRGPRGNRATTLFSPAYDAGSETNDELCVSIPGPPSICAGEGFNPADGEGYVHIHPGIQGVGDLTASQHDWHNPVAKISIRFVKK
jgi:hypothetical protein